MQSVHSRPSHYGRWDRVHARVVIAIPVVQVSCTRAYPIMMGPIRLDGTPFPGACQLWGLDLFAIDETIWAGCNRIAAEEHVEEDVLTGTGHSVNYGTV